METQRDLDREVYTERMEKVSTSQARVKLADLVSRVEFGTERILLTRHGKSVSALVSMADLKVLQACDARDDAIDEAFLRGEEETLEQVLHRNGYDPKKFAMVETLLRADSLTAGA